MMILLTMLAIGVVFVLILKKIPMSEGGDDTKGVARGFFLVFIGHVIGLVITFLSTLKYAQPVDLEQILKTFLAIMFIYQLIYVVPLAIVALAKQRKDILKGILIAAGVTFLLSVISCSPMCLANI